MDLRVGHLYPDLMNIYGDKGNVIALAQRARWRGIEVEVRPYSLGEWTDADWPDVWFFGGGQDQGQDLVGADLAGKNGAALKRSVEAGAAIFSVCGGYQLLGHEYVPESGPAIPGVGILDVATRAGKKRFVGNLLAESAGGQLIAKEVGVARARGVVRVEAAEAVGHHDDQRQVAHVPLDPRAAVPDRVVVAHAVQQVERRVLALPLLVTRGRVDVHPAEPPQGRRVVRDLRDRASISRRSASPLGDRRRCEWRWPPRSGDRQ